MPAPRVVDGRRGLGRDLPDPRAQLGVDGGRGRLLDQLLVAALKRAVALAEVDHVAVRVREHLDLDVTRVGQVALEVHGRVGEELLALAGGALEGGLELVIRQRDPEALAAAAARGLDRDRVADRLLDHPAGVVDGLDRLGRPRDDRDAGIAHQLARAGLGAHRLDRRRGRPDEHRAAVLERLREARVLGQEAVSRVHGLGAGALDRVEQLVDREIALARRAGTEQVGLVGALDVQRVAVELGVDRDGGDPELLAGTNDSDRDLAAVGDQDLREHAAGTLAALLRSDRREAGGSTRRC